MEGLRDVREQPGLPVAEFAVPRCAIASAFTAARQRRRKPANAPTVSSVSVAGLGTRVWVTLLLKETEGPAAPRSSSVSPNASTAL